MRRSWSCCTVYRTIECSVWNGSRTRRCLRLRNKETGQRRPSFCGRRQTREARATFSRRCPDGATGTGGVKSPSVKVRSSGEVMSCPEISYRTSLGDVSQELFKIASFRNGHCSGLAGDPGANAVRGFVDLRQRGSLAVTVHERGGKGIASANGISHLCFYSRVLVTFFGRHEEAAIRA